MKWMYQPLQSSDNRPKVQIIDNLSIGAVDHALTKRLLAQFGEASGPIFAITLESIDLDGEDPYVSPTYGGGSRAVGEPIAWEDAPIWGLVEFVDQWLQHSTDAAVICENFFATRQSVALHPRESRIACFGDEVYHILSNADARNKLLIECALRESEHNRGAGVCTHCKELPQAEIASEEFFDEVVAHTSHIFTPAFDNEGYLVWSPLVLRGQR